MLRLQFQGKAKDATKANATTEVGKDMTMKAMSAKATVVVARAKPSRP